MTPDDPMWEDLWHGVIWAAYVRAARECGGPPASDAVRRRAYALYEAELRSNKAEG